MPGGTANSNNQGFLGGLPGMGGVSGGSPWDNLNQFMARYSSSGGNLPGGSLGGSPTPYSVGGAMPPMMGGGGTLNAGQVMGMGNGPNALQSLMSLLRGGGQ